MRIIVAFRAFFTALFNSDAAVRIDQALKQVASNPVATVVKENNESKLAPPTTTHNSAFSKRSEALTLLSTLQREARLVDLIQEPLDEYSDAQVGAAARDVLRESSKVLGRLFDLHRVVQANEGEPIDIPKTASASSWKIIGNATSTCGTLIHAGWAATHVAVPQWTGNPEESLVVAPAEVETN